MKILILFLGSISLLAFLHEAVIPPAGAAEVEWGGGLEIKGDLNLTKSGKTLVFPDATRQGTAPPAYVRTVVVSPVGSPTQNGTELLEKRASIKDASSTKPYLLKIEPGVYDIGTNSLVMGEYVDLEGAGPGITTITGNSADMTISGASNSEIRDLTVANYATGRWSRAIYNSHSPRITNVEAWAQGSESNAAIINTSGSAPLISHVFAWAKGGSYSYGIYNHLCSARLLHVKADASDASSDNYAVRNDNMTSLIIENSSARAQSGSYAIGIYIHETTSASLVNLTSEASGASGYGIKSTNSQVLMRDVTARASGTAFSYGIYMSGNPLLINVIAEASNSLNCFGILNSSGSPVMMNVIATAKGGTTSNYGLHNPAGAGTVILDRCTFKGSTRSVSAAAGLALKVGGSKLDGPVDAAGSWTCVHCYDGNAAALNAVCGH